MRLETWAYILTAVVTFVAAADVITLFPPTIYGYVLEAALAGIAVAGGIALARAEKYRRHRKRMAELKDD